MKLSGSSSTPSDRNSGEADGKDGSAAHSNGVSISPSTFPSSSPASASVSSSDSAPLLTAHHAYAANDVEACRHYHSTQRRQAAGQTSDAAAEAARRKASEAHTPYGEHLKSIVYGGLDGIITTFATVTSVAGAQLSPVVIVVLGISHLVADGLSMGTGDAMSSQAEIELNRAERRRERWEMEHNMRGEVEEMVDIYCSKGIARADAELILTTMARYPQHFLDHMMVEELGLPPPEDDAMSPVKAGVITMLSFMTFGAVPLLPYLLALLPGLHRLMSDELQLWASVITTVLTLFTLGVVKGRVSGGRSSLWSGLQMALNGSFAAVLGFVVGWAMGRLVRLDEQQLPPGAG